MRKIYLFDLGLLVLAGTIAAALTAKPVQSQTDPEEETAHKVVACTEVPQHADCEPGQVRPK